MSQVHANGIDVTLKAGTTSVATSTAEYHAVYFSGDNTVALVNTTTNYSKFAGIIQQGGYANSVNGSVRVRMFGPSKAVFSGVGTITAAGDYAALYVDTTTAWGRLTLQTRIAGATPTVGSSFIVGQALEITGATGTVNEIFINPSFSSAITSTVAN